MMTRNFKDTDEKISTLAMGCMRLPTKRVDNHDEIDEQKAFEIIDYAYDHGINYYDTAYMYHEGKSEEFMGRALEKYDRSSINIATKLPIWMAETPADMERIFNEQLKNLRTDYFDFYLLHALDRNNFKRCKDFGAYEFITKMRDEGKIRHIGFSFHDTPDILQEIVDAYEWDFAQIQLNYYDWEFQNAKKQYEILEEKNIQCIVMEPVRGGALANPCEKSNEIFKSARPDKSVASWAIRYVATMPNVLTILSGMSSLEQIKDNVNTMTNFEPVDDNDAKTIELALEAYKMKDTIPCTGCRYCMDCTSGVDIPKVFTVYNKFAITKNREEFIKNFNELPEIEQPASCIACGVCATHCPQSIAIPEELEKINNLYKEFTK